MKNKQTIIWIGALVLGVIIGIVNIQGVNSLMYFIATVYTRLFQLLAVPTIALTVTVTLAKFGTENNTGRIFSHALTYTLLTTFVAAFVGLALYLLISPDNLPHALALKGASNVPHDLGKTTYYDHIISVIPNNILKPLLDGNVLSILLLAFVVGFALAKMRPSENKDIVVKSLLGLQSLLFTIIRGLIWTLPFGIMAFAAQLTVQVSAGVVISSLGKYTAVVLIGNVLQIFIVLPIFLLLRGINPLHAFARMSPAVLMAFFTKSSAATLPVTMETAEQRMGVSKKVSSFVLPVCTTINMNGCAAFILVTSLFLMQNGGIHLSLSTMLLWVLIAVISAIGNAGVPMGCYFLTLSLMTGVGAPVGIMGIILPIYTIIDMVETAENVWSDSTVAIMTDHDLRKRMENKQ